MLGPKAHYRREFNRAIKRDTKTVWMLDSGHAVAAAKQLGPQPWQGANFAPSRRARGTAELLSQIRARADAAARREDHNPSCHPRGGLPRILNNDC